MQCTISRHVTKGHTCTKYFRAHLKPVCPKWTPIAKNMTNNMSKRVTNCHTIHKVH